MNPDTDQQEPAQKRELSPSADCPLTSHEQTRNLAIFGTNVGLIYLAAPVLYVGIVQAALIKKLGGSTTVANLPTTAYFWMTPLPIVVAWYYCSVRVLKPVLVITYLTVAFTGAVVAASLLLSSPPWAITSAMIGQAAILGCGLGVVATYQWEVLGRGVSETRRGQALALAFGVGPVFAVLGSLVSQLILDGWRLENPISFGPFTIPAMEVPRLEYPWNFATLFGATVPIMALAALLATKFVVPLPPFEVEPKPFVDGVLGGLGEFFSYRLILVAALGMILVTSGYNILPNISLFTKDATGSEAEAYVGYQNALRFGFKVVTGLFLGWLLVKTNPKAGLLVTTGFCLASVVWARSVPGPWFLISFGLMGAGELFGVYYPNYILCCSAPSRMRRNMAFTSMLNMPSGFAAVMFGLIADKADLKRSFDAAIWILVATILLVQVALPTRPRPRDADMDDSDRVLAGAGSDKRS
jgi:hypothetical protein